MFVGRDTLAINQFMFEVFKVGIIESELPLQSTIRDAAPTSEYLDNLVKDLKKVHPTLRAFDTAFILMCQPRYYKRLISL
jgi:hypothetical protein